MDTILSRSTRSSTISHRQKGTHYEQQARHYLERVGLVFIAANVVVRGGEIDLIMRDHYTWIFVEVRYRASNHFGDAVASVTLNKQRRLQHAAAVWLNWRGGSLQTTPCRFDIVAIMGMPPHYEWLPNAFNFDR